MVISPTSQPLWFFCPKAGAKKLNVRAPKGVAQVPVSRHDLAGIQPGKPDREPRVDTKPEAKIGRMDHYIVNK